MLTAAFPQGERTPQAALQAGFAWSFISCLTWMGAWCSTVPWAENWCEAHNCLGTWWVKGAVKCILFTRNRLAGRNSVNQLHQLNIFLDKQQPMAVSTEIPIQHHELQHSLFVTSCTLESGSSTKHHLTITVVRQPPHRLQVELNARFYSGVTSQSQSPLRTQAMQQKTTIIFLKSLLFPESLLSISSPCVTTQT